MTGIRKLVISTLNSINYFCERQHQIITRKVETDEFYKFSIKIFCHLQFSASIVYKLEHIFNCLLCFCPASWDASCLNGHPV